MSGLVRAVQYTGGAGQGESGRACATISSVERGQDSSGCRTSNLTMLSGFYKQDLTHFILEYNYKLSVISYLRT